MSVGPTTSLPVSALPAIDPALEPAAIRGGNQAAKNAYDTGLAFEDMLMNELAQQLTSSVPGLNGGDGSGGLDGSGDDGTDGTDSLSGDGSGGSALSAYSSMLPDALTSAVMGDGGTGIAYQIAQSLDPALLAPAKGQPASAKS